MTLARETAVRRRPRRGKPHRSLPASCKTRGVSSAVDFWKAKTNGSHAAEGGTGIGNGFPDGVDACNCRTASIRALTESAAD